MQESKKEYNLFVIKQREYGTESTDRISEQSQKWAKWHTDRKMIERKKQLTNKELMLPNANRYKDWYREH